MHKPTQRSPAIRRTPLALRRETIAHLTVIQLRAVAGGAPTGTCQTCNDNECNLSQLGACSPNSSDCGGA